MPPVRRNRQLTSPPGADSLQYCHNDISPPAVRLSSLPFPPSPETDVLPDAFSRPQPVKKKRSHGKAKPSGHIPRPPNAFILFRTEYIRSQAKQNSTPEVSKSLGQMWRNLSPSEKRPWIERAEEEKILHKERYPDYKYKPIHRRDEFGNCIRKPRSPNRPRMKKPPTCGDVLDYLPESFQWLEAKPDVEFPNADLPSDASSVSSPPPSPSPAPPPHRPLPSTYYLSHRRSSSVPLAGPDGNFLLGTDASSANPSSPGFLSARRLSKRPSTSIDFLNVGQGHSEVYSLSNSTETYLFPNDWRLGQRRSISAPDFGGEIPNLTFPCHSAPQEPNPLIPINPVFGTMFDNFSWNAPRTSDTISQNEQTDYVPTQPISALNHSKRVQYITVQIPPTTASSSDASTLPDSTSPPSVPTPSSSQLSGTPTLSIVHPAPVATFNFSAFQEQMSQFEFDAAAVSQACYEDPLAVVAQTCLSDAGAMYNVDEQYTLNPGDNHTVAAGGSTAMQAAPLLDPALIPRPANNQATDLQGYQEGLRYTRRRPEINPPHALSFNELIVDY